MTAFIEDAGSPVDSVESAISRQNRPPAPLKDVRSFWKTVLECQDAARSNETAGTVIVTFGGPALADFSPVFRTKGKYAGDTTVWIPGFRTSSFGSPHGFRLGNIP